MTLNEKKINKKKGNNQRYPAWSGVKSTCSSGICRRQTLEGQRRQFGQTTEHFSGPCGVITREPNHENTVSGHNERDTLPVCATHIHTLVSSYLHFAKNVHSYEELKRIPNFLSQQKRHINLSRVARRARDSAPSSAILERLWFGMATAVTPLIVTTSP